MKSSVLIATGLTALIGGCASMSQQAATYDNGVDAQKVAAINSAARVHGVDVHWVNYPQRKQTSSDNLLPALGEPTGT